MPSHCIPLAALAKVLVKSFACSFLLPKMFHEAVRTLGFTVLDIDRDPEKRLMPEIAAVQGFKPHMIVDDLSPTTAFITRMFKIPRVSVVRKGIIPFDANTPGYRHSSGLDEHFKSLNQIDLSSLVGAWKPSNLSELFIGDLNIIPSIPSVEVLPPKLRGDKSYIYSGPLLLRDDEILSCVRKIINVKSINPIAVEDFFNQNSRRRIVYFTMGLAMPEEIRKRAGYCIRSLLDKGAAVITNIPEYPSGIGDEANRVLVTDFLPNEKVCSKADLMIHQCGSGTYNFQLSHQLPAIILGTNCYDRDDVARRLHQLSAAHYIPDGLREEEHRRAFDRAAAELLHDTSPRFQEQKTVLARLSDEIAVTRRDFDAEEVMRRLLREK